MVSDPFEDSIRLIDDVVNFSVEEKEEINQADAQIYAAVLREILQQKHYRTVRNNEDLHLAESVMVQKKNFSNIRNGAVKVGFDQSKAYIANFIENGTRFPMVKKDKNGMKYRFNKGGQVAIKADPFSDEALIGSKDSRDAAVGSKVDEIIARKVAKHG